ncbi:aminodeoxychorismate/anthranilate synthase component II [Candidatus Sumerlaeota bacterium]|nr:aminodeoxychorismate/anthranilate synthase component II [Candidatus Sumerlaeota bacterium]
MLLMIDNYDSFTYNLVQCLGEIGVEDMRVVRNDEVTLNEVEAMAPERIVISPGPCTPNEAGISVAVVKRLGSRLPILGVCLGHQSIGQAYGGRVVRAPKVMHGKTSEITVTVDDALWQGLESPFTATRYHSLVVERDSLPSCLEVTAEADGLIMGLRHRDHPVRGMQFHPESIKTDVGHDLLRNFLRI